MAGNHDSIVCAYAAGIHNLPHKFVVTYLPRRWHCGRQPGEVRPAALARRGERCLLHYNWRSFHGGASRM